MKKMGVAYKVGVILSFLSMSGIAEAITGHGELNISIILFVAGLFLCMTGYIK